MPPHFPGTERRKKFGMWPLLPKTTRKYFGSLCGQSRDSLTSRTSAYCSFTSSTELATFLTASLSRFSKALASDWAESRLTLQTKWRHLSCVCYRPRRTCARGDVKCFRTLLLFDRSPYRLAAPTAPGDLPLLPSENKPDSGVIKTGSRVR